MTVAELKARMSMREFRQWDEFYAFEAEQMEAAIAAEKAKRR